MQKLLHKSFLTKNSKKSLLVLFSIIFIVCGFYWRVFVYQEVPLPGDFIVGVYHPWLDYKWGTVAGVPVKNPIATDVVSFTYPMQTLAMRFLKSGIWPLWNPYILAGTTLFANFQSAPFSPTSFVYFLFNQTTAWSIQVIMQHILALYFTYLLLRRWKISRLGAIFGGTVYAFSGYNLIFSEWNGHTLASAFVPLALFFADRLLEKQKYWYGVGLSVTLALQFFSGYTQTSVYTAIAILLLWTFRIVGEKKWFTKTLILGVFSLVGIVLASVQILPSVELINNSQRVSEPHPFEWTFLPWKKIITFVAPDYFGNHVTGNYWGPQDYTSNTGFVGIVAVTLAMIACLTLFKKRETKFLVVLGIVALILSFANPISIFIWKHNILGMQANSAHRATSLFCAAMAFLCAFGFDELITNSRKFWSKVLSLVPVYVLIFTFGLFAIFLYKNNIGLRNLVFPAGILVSLSVVLFLPRRISKYLLFVLMIGEMFRFGWKFTPISPKEYTYPTTAVIEFLQNQEKPFRTTGAKVIPSNLRMAYGIESIEGYDTFHPLNVSEFIAGINSGNVNSLPVGRYGIVDNNTSRLLDLVNTKYYLALKIDNKRFTDNDRFKLVFEDKSVEIYESTTALPRAFMVYNWEVNSPQNDHDLTVLGKLLQEDFPIGEKVLLESVPSVIKNNVKEKTVQTVEYKLYDSQESIIEVDTNMDGMLFVSDAYYPGWKAFVDERETEIKKADFAFRAIEVPKGKHSVKMIYEPESFYTGLKISLATLAILVIIGGVQTLWKRRS